MPRRPGIVGPVTPRQRTVAIVAAVSVAAAGVTVGVTLAQSDRARTAIAGAPVVGKPLEGAPPLVLELGVRNDAEARALRSASGLLAAGKRVEAARRFSLYHSVDAQVAQIVAQWSPDAGLRGLQALALEHPDSGLVQLHLGLGLVWVGRLAEAEKAWRLAVDKDPDTGYAVRAGDLLHPDLPRGLPVFVPSFPDLPGLDGLAPAAQLALLKRRAEQGGAHDRIAYGIALQRLERRVSAEGQLALAAAAAPDDPEALAAAAFGRFDKERPERAFSQLGPLAKRFPRSATIRYHLGVLLLWLGQIDQARKELRLAVGDGRTGEAVVAAAQALLAELAKLKR